MIDGERAISEASRESHIDNDLHLVYLGWTWWPSTSSIFIKVHGSVSYHFIFKLAKIRDAHEKTEILNEGEGESMGGVKALYMGQGQDRGHPGGYVGLALRGALQPRDAG